MRNRVLQRVLLASTALFSLAGCATTETPDSIEIVDSSETPNDNAVPWVEPSWMAQARLDVDEFNQAMLACYAEAGLTDVVPAPGGGLIGGGFTEMPPLEVRQQRDQVAIECAERIPEPALWNTPADMAAYERMLETRECITAHGFEMREPPNPELWLQMPSTARWGPWREITQTIPVQFNSFSEYRELRIACPQSGHDRAGIFVVGWDEDPMWGQ